MTRTPPLSEIQLPFPCLLPKVLQWCFVLSTELLQVNLVHFRKFPKTPLFLRCDEDRNLYRSNTSFRRLKDCYDVSIPKQRTIYETSISLEGQTSSWTISKNDMLLEHSKCFEWLKNSKPSMKKFTISATYSPSLSSLSSLHKVRSYLTISNHLLRGL